jgi:L-aspartate oxidase
MTTQWDSVVIGSGLAGLTYALRASEYGKVCVLTKAQIADSNTSWAQGGIAAAVGESDSWELHEKDTLIAGAGLCDPDAVRQLVMNAPDAILWLQSIGTQFDGHDLDQLTLGREGGHSRHRIVHFADRTGWEIERAVTEAVRNSPNITVFEEAFVSSLLMSGDRCVGARANIAELGERDFLGSATLVATGGCGMVYTHTTNPRVATADGIGLADRVGAEIEGMEFMQFHPTVLVHPQMRGFLITEACRGAGGTLRNHRGKRFMNFYDDRLELAPRDIVSRSIEREMERLDTWCVYLDIAHLAPELIKEEFPTIWERLRSIGIEIEKEWIPVAPAQHYSCGGIKTDLNGQTNIPGLYASGEVACTGVHGANRLASNSLLEAMVFSKQAAEAAQSEPAPSPADEPSPTPSLRESDAIRIRHSLQHCMTHGAGVFRSDKGLMKAQEQIVSLEREVATLPEAPFSAYAQEAVNMLAAARHVVASAIERKDNVGLHYNVDSVAE